jgi:hypothetical protein
MLDEIDRDEVVADLLAWLDRTVAGLTPALSLRNRNVCENKSRRTRRASTLLVSGSRARMPMAAVFPGLFAKISEQRPRSIDSARLGGAN